MFWLSIYKSLLESWKLRQLAKDIGCSQNEAIGMLLRVWFWAADNVNQNGKIISADKEDIADVISVGMDKRYNPTDAVEMMIKNGWIDEDDKLYIHDWEDWQKALNEMNKTRDDATRRKRISRLEKKITLILTELSTGVTSDRIDEAKSALKKISDLGEIAGVAGGRIKKLAETLEMYVSGNINMEANLALPNHIIPSDEENSEKTEEIKNPPKPKKSQEEYSEGFLKFWEVYPRKVGKGEAFKKYKTRIKAGWKPEELYEAAVNYAAKVTRERTETMYIKYPATFLSDSEPFTDYLPKEQETLQMAFEENEDNPYADWR